ncbi:uncharacterized protein B0T15DRAFT_230792 [Chaetomium strumarium]|uniref:RING-type domain-containing protein n=1 Tax=Chaetomium strumarium TaxID=1170767 RepID=A0AAJ0GQB5_9PEZI|nr:hypothetical protein B0T15DRAFT_230792 [Chaetomium strumarium]
MPPPNTPEGVVTAPASPPASPAASQPTALLTGGGAGNTPLPEPEILELDYLSIEYVGPVDETLLCPICRTPFHSPVMMPCGHTFCVGCINQALEARSVCPLDRQPINKTRDYCRSPLIVKEQLDRLKVKCPNRRCDYECNREHLRGHYERRCEYTPVRCPIPDCTKYVARRDAKSENGCLHKEFPCQYCGEAVTSADCDDHYTDSCKGAIVSCDECGETVVRHRLGKHLAQDCPEGIARCKWHAAKWHRARCQVKGKRRDVREHERGCAYEFINELKDLRDQRARREAEDRQMINDLAARLARVEAASRRKRRPRERRERHEQGNEPAPMNETPLNPGNTETASRSIPTRNDETSLLPDFPVDNGARASPEAPSPEDYMLAQFERIEGHLEDLRKQMMEMDAHQSLGLLRTTARFNEQFAELGSKVGVLNMHTTWLMNMQRQTHVQQRTGSTTAGPPTAGISHTDDTSTTGALSSGTGVRYQAASRRSSSSGRGEHPPRL